MRTIKASEVVKGMRVRVEREYPASGPRQAYTIVFEGIVSDATGQRFTIGEAVNDYTFWADSIGSTTVTVLAEPEPEWVEGAWYWVRTESGVTPACRIEGGWSRWTDDDSHYWSDKYDSPTVVGRILIVDWPGDDVARTLAKWPDGTAPLRDLDKAVEKVADAIRTQGGAP